MNAVKCLGLAVCLAAGTAWGQSVPVREVDAIVLNEGYSPTVSVSGRPLVGAMLEPRGRPNGRELFVWVPAEVADGNARLCLSLLAQDGRYTGFLKAAFVEGPTPYLLRVRFQSGIPAYYAEERHEHLAILAEVKERCSPEVPRDHILPASWEPTPEISQMTVLVNSSRMRTLVVVPRREGRSVAIECQEIKQPHTVAFDKACRLDFAELAQRGELLFEQSSLVRLRGPSQAPLVPLPLAR